MKDIDKMIKIIQAYKNGKQIEFKNKIPDL